MQMMMLEKRRNPSKPFTPTAQQLEDALRVAVCMMIHGYDVSVEDAAVAWKIHSDEDANVDWLPLDLADLPADEVVRRAVVYLKEY